MDQKKLSQKIDQIFIDGVVTGILLAAAVVICFVI
jgi:formate/nitrite transporter FocA (FNT family)